MDFKFLLIVHEKRLKKAIAVTVVYSILLIASIFLFIFLSNYKTQVLMSILGSIVSSIFAILLIYVVTCRLLFNLSYVRFFKRLINEETKTIKVEKVVEGKLVTVKKNIVLKEFVINDSSYYSLVDDISIKKNDVVEVASNYIKGKKNG